MDEKKKQDQGDREHWTKDDYMHVFLMILITLMFSIRTGPLFDAIFATLRHVIAYFVYGLVMVLIFVGLTKKMFKLNPTRKKMLKWAFGLAAFFAVNQFFHEAFLVLTGQKSMP